MESVEETTPRKRKRSSSSSGAGPSAALQAAPSAAAAPRTRVSFGSVRVRTHDVEIWGGGGVPADDGPPLGLGWNVQGEEIFALDAFESERKGSRITKDSYCMLGCVEPGTRERMLLGAGSTLKQIKAVTKQVEQLNQERWRASEILFRDVWLFRAPRHADAMEVLAMLGQPDGYSCELSTSNWHSAEACARELAPTLGVAVEALLSGPASAEDAEEGEGGDEDIVWSAACDAMQNLSEQVVLLIRCDEVYSLGLELLGRLVGCVANAHVAAQVMHAQRGNVSVVLHGWADDKIEADWSDDEPDEFCISPLH
uniref:Uncharacterized protein n=1 Tax=Haptolina brevifila TaxID=156173 RepID=A0A7S2CKB8_9EUKA|mmetsp:Transcript_25980/g.52085  ORF Transcript_25980/g.52085 Transcript_25980/m.52085 type:complete len:312 (+) Transcript_25980:69-1004(+)